MNNLTSGAFWAKKWIIKVKHFSEETKKHWDAQETGPASLQVIYNWHLSFIGNHWTSNNASIFTPTLMKMAHTHAKIKQGG